MEEKKPTDEVVAKNAITDEEIAKAILQQVEYNAGIPYIDEWLKVKTIKFVDILNFIHRLQSEKKELKSIAKYQQGSNMERWRIIQEKDKTIAEQKAEIERLKNAYREGLEQGKFDSQVKIAELQKQVDELKAENTELYKEHTTLIAGSILAKQSIAKDTAKEILIPLIETEKQIDLLKTGIRWSILKGFCKHYGIEVE